MVPCTLAARRNRVLDQAHWDSPQSRCMSGARFAATRRLMLFARIAPPNHSAFCCQSSGEDELRSSAIRPVTAWIRVEIPGLEKDSEMVRSTPGECGPCARCVRFESMDSMPAIHHRGLERQISAGKRSRVSEPPDGQQSGSLAAKLPECPVIRPEQESDARLGSINLRQPG
jgi:hypothetical protein